jgi:DNA-binding NtrC family response regulator
MLTPTVILASSDSSLINSVRSLFLSFENLKLEIMSTTGEGCEELLRRDVLLIIIHLDESRAIADVSRLLKMITLDKSSILILVISDQHNPEVALAILRLGVVDCLYRPLDLGRLDYLIDVLTYRGRTITSRPAPISERAQEAIAIPTEKSSFIDPPTTPMGRMMEQVGRVAPRDTTVLLGGETGTGKSRLAGLIHRLSSRRDEPFITINCGALSENLVDSEMFGHQKGAFTGADTNRVGKFAAVGQGTLFLDEIDSLTRDLQTKLLRAVDERVFEPVGSNKSQPMQARLIAACNRSLEEEISAGRFRIDLYYRLNVCNFVVPALRDHLWDIPRLTRGFINEFDVRSGQPIHEISPEALDALAAHDWPGNIRELRNVIECALALCPGDVIQLDDLPELFHPRDTVAPLSSPREPDAAEGTLAQTRNMVELDRITETLGRHNNNRLRAAAELGISRMTLYNKLHKYGLI